MNPIVFTLANESHASILADFRIKFLIDFGGPQPEEAQRTLAEALQNYFKLHLSTGSYICWFAAAGDEIAGIGGMKILDYPGNFKNTGGRKGYVMNMYTRPEFRKKGICSTILNKLIQTANGMDIHSFELHATKEGEPVYIKNGFELHNEPTYRKWDSRYFQ